MPARPPASPATAPQRRFGGAPDAVGRIGPRELGKRSRQSARAQPGEGRDRGLPNRRRRRPRARRERRRTRSGCDSRPSASITARRTCGSRDDRQPPTAGIASSGTCASAAMASARREPDRRRLPPARRSPAAPPACGRCRSCCSAAIAARVTSGRAIGRGGPAEQLDRAAPCPSARALPPPPAAVRRPARLSARRSGSSTSGAFDRAERAHRGIRHHRIVRLGQPRRATAATLSPPMAPIASTAAMRTCCSRSCAASASSSGSEARSAWRPRLAAAKYRTHAIRIARGAAQRRRAPRGRSTLRERLRGRRARPRRVVLRAPRSASAARARRRERRRARARRRGPSRRCRDSARAAPSAHGA